MLCRRFTASATAALSVLSVASQALAATAQEGPGINPGVRMGAWIYNNVTALFVPILAAMALYYLAKREFTRFLSFAVFAALVAFLVFGADDFKDSALALTRWVLAK